MVGCNGSAIGLIAQTRKNSLKMRVNGELMLRNAKFYRFVTRKAATALYKSFEGFKLQAKVD
jgi:hypothetical protein